MKVQFEQTDIQKAMDLLKELDVPWKVLNPIIVILMTKHRIIHEATGNPTVDRILAGGKITEGTVETVQLPELVV